MFTMRGEKSNRFIGFMNSVLIGFAKSVYMFSMRGEKSNKLGFMNSVHIGFVNKNSQKYGTNFKVFNVNVRACLLCRQGQKQLLSINMNLSQNTYLNTVYDNILFFIKCCYLPTVN